MKSNNIVIQSFVEEITLQTICSICHYIQHLQNLTVYTDNTKLDISLEKKNLYVGNWRFFEDSEATHAIFIAREEVIIKKNFFYKKFKNMKIPIRIIIQ